MRHRVNREIGDDTVLSGFIGPNGSFISLAEMTEKEGEEETGRFGEIIT